jgi:Plasmid pRiA4b ORF-3-like protein
MIRGTSEGRLSPGEGLVARNGSWGQTGGMSRTDDVAVLRIELEDIKPLIWRRVAVRTSMKLKAVHRVIQAAMGWLDYHVWEFEANKQKYGMLVPNEPEWNERIKNAAATKLSSLLAGGVIKIDYVYDMGDNWQHRIIIEKQKAGEPEVRYPQFLGESGDVRRRIAGACLATTSSWTISPANKRKGGKPRSIGMAGRMTRMKSTSRRSSRG